MSLFSNPTNRFVRVEPGPEVSTFDECRKTFVRCYASTLLKAGDEVDHACVAERGQSEDESWAMCTHAYMTILMGAVLASVGVMPLQPLCPSYNETMASSMYEDPGISDEGCLSYHYSEVGPHFFNLMMGLLGALGFA